MMGVFLVVSILITALTYIGWLGKRTPRYVGRYNLPPVVLPLRIRVKIR